MSLRLPALVVIVTLAGGAALLAAADGPATTPPPAAGTFKNVKVLTHVTSKAEMRRIMKEQAASLGVKCTHCHVQGKFEADDKEEKQQAREMMKMTAEINAKWLKNAETKPAVTCWTCHQGKEEPEHAIPAAALAATDAQDAAP